MGLLSGAANFVEFKTMNVATGVGAMEFIVDQIRVFGFGDIDETYDTYSIGWVSPLDMFNSEFQPEEGGIVVASLRIDERKVPSPVLKKSLAKAFKQEMEEKQLPKLSRGAKVAIKERVLLALTKKAEPVATVVEMVWDVDKQEILFFSTNKKIQALFEDLFKESFGLVIQQKVPYTIAEELVDAEALAGISACSFI